MGVSDQWAQVSVGGGSCQRWWITFEAGDKVSKLKKCSRQHESTDRQGSDHRVKRDVGLLLRRQLVSVGGRVVRQHPQKLGSPGLRRQPFNSGKFAIHNCEIHPTCAWHHEYIDFCLEHKSMCRLPCAGEESYHGLPWG